MNDEYKLELYRDLPGYANLTAEQKVTADRWDREKEVREALYKELSAAEEAKDNIAFRKILDRLAAIGKDYCEHGRSWASAHCIGCDKIEKVLLPEWYCKNDDCDYPLEDDEIKAGIQFCECCREEDDAV